MERKFARKSDMPLSCYSTSREFGPLFWSGRGRINHVNPRGSMVKPLVGIMINCALKKGCPYELPLLRTRASGD